MLDITARKEVLDFVLVSEALRSPVLLDSALTKEECAVIAECILNMSRTGQPWSTALPVRYNL